MRSLLSEVLAWDDVVDRVQKVQAELGTTHSLTQPAHAKGGLFAHIRDFNNTMQKVCKRKKLSVSEQGATDTRFKMRASQTLTARHRIDHLLGLEQACAC